MAKCRVLCVVRLRPGPRAPYPQMVVWADLFLAGPPWQADASSLSSLSGFVPSAPVGRLSWYAGSMALGSCSWAGCWSLMAPLTGACPGCSPTPTGIVCRPRIQFFPPVFRWNGSRCGGGARIPRVPSGRGMRCSLCVCAWLRPRSGPSIGSGVSAAEGCNPVGPNLRGLSSTWLVGR